jgi:hypothetical protein
MKFDVTLISGGVARRQTVEIETGIIAGWTGRDREGIRKHVAELEELGVKAPRFTPTFYRVSVSRFTMAPAIEVIGAASSGEVEFLILTHDGRIWIGVGSDHTDREVETYDVTVSKQLCDKPIASEFWCLDDLVDHWDSLILTAFIQEAGERRLYQHCNVTQMLAPRTLMSLYSLNGQGLPENALMFCGTSPAIGGIRPASRFEMSLHDPVLGRTIGHQYAIISIPFFAETRETEAPAAP